MTTSATGLGRVISWLPTTVDRRVRVLAWLSLIFQTVLIGTGGAVRLTGSGLGCPTWPKCTEESLINTPEMGIHGIIEFGNRMLTFVLVAIAILAFLSVWNLRKRRRDLFWITFWQGMSIPFQAVMGGITVLTGLNSYVVGAHFFVSLALVALTTMLVYRVYRGAPGAISTPPIYRVTTLAVLGLTVLTAIVGILTTGSGPHAGDRKTPRNGLDPELMQHLHAWPGYALTAVTVIAVILAFTLGARTRFPLWLLLAQACQVALGITQSRLGLPEAMVGAHMVLAGVVMALATATVLSTRDSIPEPSPERARADLAPAGTLG